MTDDPYKILQVDREADPEVIQAAYRRLARKYHPDVAPGPEAAARMAAINRAWSLIGDPERRAAYDRELAVRPAAVERAPAASPFRAPASPPPPEVVSRDWTTGRSNVGGGYDPLTMKEREGLGAAGPPPGNASGSVLKFGRYAGWSVGEIARRDLEYLEWLDRVPIGRAYREEIDAILRRTGRRRSSGEEATARRGLFRRR